MILVIEGISASGKTTWCAKHAAKHIVPENGRVENAPNRAINPEAAAAFWVKLNADRWSAALRMEHRSQTAVCDTDPLKLHYAFGLRRLGEISEKAWQVEVAATRAAIADRDIGFADAYFVQTVADDKARAQARDDLTRKRTNFELHLRLQPSLTEWYRALSKVLPGRVHFGFPDHLPFVDRASRFPGVMQLDRLIAELD